MENDKNAALENQETPKKRKGRPRKQASENTAETNTEKKTATKDTAQKTENSAPRRVGRPKKTAVKTAEKEAVKREKKTDSKKISAAKNTLPEESTVIDNIAAEKSDKKVKQAAKSNLEKSTEKTPPKRGRKKSAKKTEDTVVLALTEKKRLALTGTDTKELPLLEHSQNVPAPLQNMEIAVYEQGTIAVIQEKDKNSTKQEKTENIPQKTRRGRRKKSKENPTEQNTVPNADAEQTTPAEQEAAVKIETNFVAGVNGIVEYNGKESLSAFGEQAGLGVLGVIEEAPIIDAVLPLVSEAEKPHKKSRKRGRKKKNQKQSEPHLAQEYDNSSIVEGDEIAIIEAEKSLQKAKKGKKSAKTEKKEHIRRVLYVSTVPDEQVEVVITENGIVSEYFVEMAHQSKIRGNIYKGVINNVDTNLQAVFVNFGCGKNGFLQIDEVHPEYYLTPHEDKGKKYPPIQNVLKVGQEILVQVVKEPNGTKGAFLTTWISLAGRFLVLTPGQEQIGVSRKVEDNEERQRLRTLLNGINPGENMGVIIRTASEGASKTHIQKDLQVLKRAWKNIQKQVQKSPAPSLVYQEADLSTRAVRDYLNEDIDEVWVDNKDVQKSISDLIKVIFPRNKEMLHLHDDNRQTLWERFNITRQLEEVTKREVNLPSGGRLVFDQTEALLAIDINSGKSQGKNNFEAMVYRTNMEAVEAIARHLRLRDIGGQVVIDFIEMRDKNHCREIEKSMQNAMKRDRARHDIGKLSSFGLLELVRQRTGSSVISITSEPCPHCRGTGFRRNLEWQAQSVLREIKSKLAGKNVPSTYVHHVEQEVALYILNKKRDRLSELEQEFSVKIDIYLK